MPKSMRTLQINGKQVTTLADLDLLLVEKSPFGVSDDAVIEWGDVKAMLDLLYITATSTNTLTNKRLTKRVVTVTQSATPSINTDNGDVFVITGLAQAITSLTTNLTGTPTQGQMILMEITDDGTGRAITPGASFAGTSINALTALTTVANKKLMLLWKWSSALSKWELVAKDQSL